MIDSVDRELEIKQIAWKLLTWSRHGEITVAKVQEAFSGFFNGQDGEKFIRRFNTSWNTLLERIARIAGYVGNLDDIKTDSENREVEIVEKLPEKQYSPFPEWITEESIPAIVYASWSSIQKSQTPEKQRQIKYYIRDGVWCIKMWELPAIRLINESAEHNPEKGVKVKGRDTLFTAPAARRHAKKLWRKLPRNEQWRSMKEFLGWSEQLKDALQFSYNETWAWYSFIWWIEIIVDRVQVRSCSLGWYLHISQRRGSKYVSSTTDRTFTCFYEFLVVRLLDEDLDELF